MQYAFSSVQVFLVIIRVFAGEATQSRK